MKVRGTKNFVADIQQWALLATLAAFKLKNNLYN